MTATAKVAERLRHILSIDPEATAIEFEGQNISWRRIGRLAVELEALRAAADIAPGVWVGWIARNHPAMVAAAIGILCSQRGISPYSPHQPLAKLAEEIRSRRPVAIVGESGDWTPELKEIARTIGALGVRLSLSEAPAAALVPDLGHHEAPTALAFCNGAAIERVTSGTTGLPRRIAVDAGKLHASLLAAAMTKSATANLGELKLQPTPAILFKPFAHSGGLWSMLMAVFHGRTVALHERFTVEAWVEAVKRHKLRVSGLVPAMIRMVLDSDTRPEDLSSLRAIRSATAPLDPEVQRQFESRFGIPVLIDYGASEFIGGVAGWSLADHKEYSEAKRGSVGRPRADIAIRIVDIDNGDVLQAGSIGVLELKSERFGPDWIRTTDLASLDADGFLFIHGRSDEAIIRGGFKVLPENVAQELRLHPLVNDACVLGVRDPRLGAVPVAFIEPRAGKAAPSPEALGQFLRERLPPYQVPVAFEIVEELPRTVSTKVSRPLLRERYAGRYAFS